MQRDKKGLEQGGGHAAIHSRGPHPRMPGVRQGSTLSGRCLTEQHSALSQGSISTPGRGECPADVRRPYFISWHRGRIFTAVSCGRGEERRWNWNRRAQPHLLSRPAVKAPKSGRRGAAARPGFQEQGRPVPGALGKRLSWTEPPRCLQQAGPRKVIQDSVLQDPGWACLLRLGWDGVRGPWLCGVGE